MTATPPLAQTVRPRGSWSAAADRLRLTHDERFLRRRRLVTESGRAILIDLAETTNLMPGDALETAEGQLIEIVAAEEPLLEITGPSLARYAWHIGNRHTPCQIEDDRLLIRTDHVLGDMLARLGATVRPCTAPFLPEGGAYGTGRTLGHSHAPADAPAGASGFAESGATRHAHEFRLEREHHFRRVHAHATHHVTAEDLGADRDGPE